ncbi:hypothetical protein CDAR_37431 [Caerostris darwini]|uniref:Uncharacterized protein n=1 Tax=Caerostris darwini TaxID=1538125 RepID=A0AAV4TSP6_9ARAC|nr:hypothetical protein CDAR_37431 [Caerostris darwini]
MSKIIRCEARSVELYRFLAEEKKRALTETAQSYQRSLEYYRKEGWKKSIFDMSVMVSRQNVSFGLWGEMQYHRRNAPVTYHPFYLCYSSSGKLK